MACCNCWNARAKASTTPTSPIPVPIWWWASRFTTALISGAIAKVESYLRGHLDDLAIHKLRYNDPLTSTDVQHLENLLWMDLGTKSDYHKEYGDESLLPIQGIVKRIDELNARILVS
jgi:type I site-specific restriction endonuclease